VRAVAGGAAPPEGRLRCATRGEDQARQLQEQFAAFQHSYDEVNFTAPFRARRSGLLGGGHDPILGPHDQYFLDLSLEFLRGPARQR
jgi:hypothetical protein